MFLDCCEERSCNKVEISKTATKSKLGGSSLLLNGARQTDNERHRRSKSEPCRVSSGALVQIVVGAATTGWRLTQLPTGSSSPASSGGDGIGGPGIVLFFNFLQIATRRKREEANKTDVAGGKCESTESLPTTKLFSIQHFKCCIAQL